MTTLNHSLASGYESRQPARGGALSLFALAIIGCATWIVYGPAIDSPFVYDDVFSIQENNSIVTLWPLVGDARHPGPLNPPQEQPIAGRPLVNLSLALNHHFGKLHPAGYRVFNLFVHLLSALLLMAIVRRTLCLDYFEGMWERASGPLAFTVALLWALHPLESETMMYVTQRTELMMGFFYLATLYCGLRYWGAGSTRGRTTWLVLSTLACLAGMACKEVMVTAPVMVLLFERTFLAGSFRRAWQNSWPLYVGLFFSWGLLAGLNYTAPRSMSAGFNLGVPAYAWWFTQTKVLLLYLKLSFWPWPLSIHYEMPYLTTPGAVWPWLAPAALLCIGTVVLVGRRNAIGFVGAWVLIILTPTLVVPIVTEVAAERRMYLPLAGLITLVVVGGYGLIAQPAARQTAAAKGKRRNTSLGRRDILPFAIAMLVAVLLAVVASRRLFAYRDELAIWQDVIKNQPGDSLAHSNLGALLLRMGRPQEALENCQQALRARPDYPQAYCNLANALLSLGQTDEAIAHYEEGLKLMPDNAEMHNNLGAALVQAGRPQEAIEHLERAQELARQRGQTAMADSIEAWLESYRAGQSPLHDEKSHAEGKTAPPLRKPNP